MPYDLFDFEINNGFIIDVPPVNNNLLPNWINADINGATFTLHDYWGGPHIGGSFSDGISVHAGWTIPIDW